MQKKFMMGLVSLIMIGCGDGEGSKSIATSATANLQGEELITYMLEHKDAKLDASDCLKFSGQDWANLYG